MGKLDDILDNARYRVASNDTLKQEIKAIMLDLAITHSSDDNTINLHSLIGEINAL